MNNPAGFGQRILDQYITEGWGSLSKRDLELLVFILLEKDGALPRSDSNYDVGRSLRVTESKVASLRRDAYARWRPLSTEQSTDVLKRVFKEALEQKRLEQTIKFATDRRMDEGFIPLLIEHPDDRAEVEHAIKEAGAIPVHERNREVLLVHHETLLKMAEDLGILEADPKKIQRKLKKILGNQDTLKDFLTTPLEELTVDGARAALNDAGSIVIESGLRTLLPKFLQAAIPIIPTPVA
ncbi:MAG: hypothetical protein Q8K62_03610 [Thiobacillus sp.]|nr:hypothetical protein [Thiobacillus sp.]